MPSLGKMEGSKYRAHARTWGNNTKPKRGAQISDEMRSKIISALDGGATVKEAAKQFTVPEERVWQLSSLLRKGLLK